MSRLNEYAYEGATISSAAVTATSAPVLPSNPARRSAVLSNSGATDCYLAFGPTAVAGQGILLKAAGRYELSCQNLYHGAINAITASGTTTLALQEGF